MNSGVVRVGEAAAVFILSFDRCTSTVSWRTDVPWATMDPDRITMSLPLGIQGYRIAWVYPDINVDTDALEVGDHQFSVDWNPNGEGWETIYPGLTVAILSPLPGIGVVEPQVSVVAIEGKGIPNGTFHVYNSGNTANPLEYQASIPLYEGWQDWSLTAKFDGPIVIPDEGAAIPFGAGIQVAGIATSVVREYTVRLNGLTHPNPDDLDILLVGSNGEAVMLMSDAGGSNPVENLTVTIGGQSGNPLPNGGQLTADPYKPGDYEPGADSFPSPAPPPPYSTNMNGLDNMPSGEWALYIVDDRPGGAGMIADGWSLELNFRTYPEWMERVEPVSGTATEETDEIGVLFTQRNWGPGTYVGKIRTSAPNTIPTFLNVPVQLTVFPRPRGASSTGWAAY